MSRRGLTQIQNLFSSGLADNIYNSLKVVEKKIASSSEKVKNYLKNQVVEL